VMESGDEFGDTNRVILAGDSAGGNVVAVMTQRLLAEKLKQPKLQVLIYPWLQMVKYYYNYFSFIVFKFLSEKIVIFKFNNKLPSSIKYSKQSRHQGKFMAWYLGHHSVSEELSEILRTNLHTLLIESDLKKKLESFTDHKMIPEQYKAGKGYYESYELIANEHIFPETLGSTSVLNTDKNLRESLRKLFSADLSPGLAEPENLIGLPKALFISCEVDPIKDHGLIYAERLRKSGVNVHVHFYENCFHGSVTLTSKDSGFKSSRNILKDLIHFLKKNI
jgi:acetyl esterase/lipase